VARQLIENGVTPHTSGRAEEAKLRPLRAPTLQEFARRAARSGLLFDPGKAFAYSMSLDVLAAVIEKAAGMSFERFVQTRLFDPLRMKSTYWQVPRSQARRLATNYTAGADGGKPSVLDPAADSVFLDPPSFPYGGAGLVSSAHDFDRLLHMLHNDGTLDGVRVMRPAAARLVRTNLLPAGMVLTDKGPMLPGEPNGFGAGGFVTTLESDGLGRKAGTFGWDGAAGTRAWVDSARRIRVTTMINIVGARNVASDVDKAVMADLASAAR
jgi:CubicO group peptidase (beta-lactamase class C family)